jgi:hypothetical protein
MRKCVTARLEIMPSVLELKREYKRMYPHVCDADAQGAAYMALREEMQRQTVALKEAIAYGRNI